jgi:hypothetical protein
MQGGLTNGFIPGENISIQAVAYAKNVLANIAYSNKVVTNSLFEEIGDSNNDNRFDTAFIGNIRHLENLDKHISNFAVTTNGAVADSEQFTIATAKQTSDFGWNEFTTKTGASSVTYSSNPGASTNTSTSSCYYPISPDYALVYDGQGHSISDIVVKSFQDAGMFGKISSVKEIKNLELIDFNITDATSAGALAGELGGCTVTNVLARNSESGATCKIAATGNAGGLIGKLTSGTVNYSAAAVIVNAGTSGNAGGLIGNASGTISGCYSGGLVEDVDAAEGKVTVRYSEEDFNVTGATAGGLVGSANNTTISNSYSTCSVSGTTVGGFAGSAGGSISNCYSTGLVNSTGTAFAFLGSGSASLSGNYYYSFINMVEDIGEEGSGSNAGAGGNGKDPVMVPMSPMDGYELGVTDMSGIRPLDLNTDAYNTFTGAYANWKDAIPYNSTLVKFYGGKYPLKTIGELVSTLPADDGYGEPLFVSIHYGDWPSPEVFFINSSGS